MKNYEPFGNYFKKTNPKEVHSLKRKIISNIKNLLARKESLIGIEHSSGIDSG